METPINKKEDLLKPCPCCGTPATVEETPGNFKIYCEQCHIGILTHPFTHVKAVIAWNRRVQTEEKSDYKDNDLKSPPSIPPRSLPSKCQEGERVKQLCEAYMRGEDGYLHLSNDASLVRTEYLKRLERSQALCEELKQAKDFAYSERNNLVAYLSKQFESHLCRHPDEDKAWENDWRWIVCIHSPKGQFTWHIHDSDLPKFKHLTHGDEHWDGHTTEEKYKRLEALESQSHNTKT